MMNVYINIVLAALIVTAANIGMTRYMLNNTAITIKTELVELNKEAPKFIVVDEGILNAELKVQPDGSVTSPAQLLADRENLFNALKLQNYIVVSSVNLLAYPITSELNQVNMQEVRAFLNASNEDVSHASDHEQTVRMAQELIDRQFSFPSN